MLDRAIQRLMNARGAGLALMSAVLFGASTPLAKLVLGEIGPLITAGLLYLGAGVGLLGYRALVRREVSETKLSRREAPWIISAVIFGGVLGPALLMLGLARTDAGAVSLLLTLEGAATALIALFIFREHIGWRNGAGFVLIALGGAALALRGGLETPDLAGPIFVAAACVAWGIDNNLTRKASNADPIAIAMWKGLAAGPANIVLALAAREAAPPLAPALGAMAIGMAGYGVSLVLFILALRSLGVARTSAYFGTAPFVGAGLAISLLGEPIGIVFLLAAALIGAGVAMHLTETHDHEHEHEATPHAHVHVHDAHHQHAHRPDDPPGEPHAHWHVHAAMSHHHPHTPDEHHRHRHKSGAP